MAQFLRVTLMSNGKPSENDVIINTAHIASVVPSKTASPGNPTCYISGRGGEMQRNSFAVSGTVDDINAALALDCLVAILSHNDKAKK